MTTQCLCQICSCGRHQCPHTPPPPVFPSSRPESASVLSEYREKFHSHGAPVLRKSKKCIQEYKKSEGEMASTTTSSSDYVPHLLTLRPPKAISTYTAPKGTMLLKTTYMRDFPPFPIHKNIVNKTVTYEPPTSKMDTQSLYREDFRCWEAARPEPIRTSDNLKVSEDQFTGTTTFQDHFCPKPMAEVRESFKPTQEIQEHQPFEGMTNYKQMYVPHQVQQRLPKQKVPYKPNSAPFSSVTIHRQDFKGLRGEVAKSSKVISSYEPSTVPFEGSSEFKEKYKAWPTVPPFQRKADVYTTPGGDMEMTTENQREFIGQPGQPAVSARPPIQAWCKGKPFEARSITKEDYRAWETKRRGQVTREEQISPPSGAFETTTTSRSDYTKKTVTRVTSCKPIQRAMSPMTLEDDTVYRASYVNREFAHCPASFADPPGFEYKMRGRGGHVLYRTASVGDRGTTRPNTATAAAVSAQPSSTAKTRLVKSAVLRRGKRTH